MHHQTGQLEPVARRTGCWQDCLALKMQKQRAASRRYTGHWQAQVVTLITLRKCYFPVSELHGGCEGTDSSPSFAGDVGLCHLSVLLTVIWICPPTSTWARTPSVCPTRYLLFESRGLTAPSVASNQEKPQHF